MTDIKTEGIDFSSFEKPHQNDPYGIANHVIELVSSYVSYDDHIYRPGLALEREKGNCYAWAQLGALALESWDMPSAIVLSQTHAHVVSKIGNTILFIDLTSGHTNDIKREAVRQSRLKSGLELELLYEKLLPPAFESRSFTLFIRKEFNGENMEWRGDKRTTVASDRPEKLYDPIMAHVIFDSSQAEDVLHAIGDLRRYRERKPEKFGERYSELKQYIPDFVRF